MCVERNRLYRWHGWSEERQIKMVLLIGLCMIMLQANRVVHFPFSQNTENNERRGCAGWIDVCGMNVYEFIYVWKSLCTLNHKLTDLKSISHLSLFSPSSSPLLLSSFSILRCTHPPLHSGKTGKKMNIVPHN